MVLTQHVAEFLKKSGVLKSDKLMVAVSGGLDSMLLWETLRLLGFKIIAVHINYNLRGVESDLDEALVRAYAEKHNLELHVFQGNPNDFTSNLQEEARIFRYSKFEDVKEATDANWVLTAHHFNDDAETFFLNLVRGAGIKGLKGISAKRGYFLRPFLELPKATLKDCALAMKLEWREDASNQTEKYLRNKIRHSVLPKVLDLDKRANSGLKNTLKVLKAQNKVFELLIASYRNQHLKIENGLGHLKLTDELVQNPQLLFEVLAPFGHFQVNQIISAKGESGKQFISDRYTLYLDRGNILIEANKTQKEINELIDESSKIHRRSNLEFSTLDSLPNTFEYSDEKAVLDFDKLEFPLTLRNWKQGDTFQPFGMKGRKKVSDCLIDKKVPLPLKNRVLVLTSGNEIVWLVGHRIDDRFKVTSKTKKIYLANLLK